MKKIYIAGPDVFEPNSIEIGKEYSALCKEYGFKGLYPLDNIVDFSQEKKKIAKDIFVANVNLIEEADIVIANLNPFRGKEADSGTIWECGYASALGKKVYGYMDDTSEYINQFSKDEKKLVNNLHVDSNGKSIEDFSHPINLMIACSCYEIIKGRFEDVLSSLVNKKI
ncbi:nucleoside 2-deoxyribosyltransferase [Candidatus Sulfurimonas marisnigri]|uniref:Nucleoside 2-deoxyribosyltransferase n=1 Tax=Candidatus Sulfurimonas marisnigri TaxID=2740405 RepID=A0A7S7M0E3_9BACT|nr:nucleoside 2-deoxyribosyltransferase [Candidatus Sulfurimonas marisnigri]QOY54803.1 nucleoside 2-deoxyribosyltransferase [Candidatus Sulfurimonas marisnigri]